MKPIYTNENGDLEALEGETEFTHIPDWFNWERQQVEKQIAEGTYSFQDEVEVYSLPRCWRFIPLGKAKLTHGQQQHRARRQHQAAAEQTPGEIVGIAAVAADGGDHGQQIDPEADADDPEQDPRQVPVDQQTAVVEAVFHHISVQHQRGESRQQRGAEEKDSIA